MNSGLTLRELTTGYPKRRVIERLSIERLPRGEIAVLLGANGCGKSTLLRAVAGLNPANGQVLLDDVNMMRQSFTERAKKVVYLPQTLPAGVHLQVLESIMVAQRASGPTCIYQDSHQVMALLEQLGIAHLALSYLDQLSGGQKQLVGLAQSLIRCPSLLLLDEPLSALDLNYQYHVMDLVRRETRQRNMVTIIVVHDINIALRHADRVLMLKSGQLMADGAPIEVITPESLATTYGVKGRVECCSQGTPQVFIDGLVPHSLL